MAEYSKGPWKVVDRSAFIMRANDAKWEIDQESGEEPFWIAVVINESNARLIAEAPILLQGLEEILDQMGALCNPSELVNFLGGDSEWATRILATVARAKGISA